MARVASVLYMPVMSQCIIRDMKRQKVVYINADSTVSSHNLIKNNVSARAMRGLTTVSDAEPCNAPNCLGGEACLLAIGGLCRLADGSCGEDAECPQASSGGVGALQKHGRRVHSDPKHRDERTRHQWTQSIGTKSEDALTDSAQLATGVTSAPSNHTPERSLNHTMAMQAVQNGTVMVLLNKSADLLQQDISERRSKLASFALQVKSQAVMMLTNYSNGMQILVSCFVVLVFALAIYAIYLLRSKRRHNAAQRELIVREVGALRTAVLKALEVRRDGDWQGTLSHFIQLRSDRVSENHPSYNLFYEHFGDATVHSQILKLFSQLSRGQGLVSQEDLGAMCAGLRIVFTNLDSGDDPRRYTPRSPKDYRWLVDCIDRPLPCSDFVTVFIFVLLYFWSQGAILFRKDNAAQAQRGDSVDRWDIDYSVDFEGQIAYHARFRFGGFDRVGTVVFASRDVEERVFRSGESANLAKARA